MCEKTQFKYCPSTIDKCMRLLIKYLNSIGIITQSCCCGHGKYPMTIVTKATLRDGGVDILSRTFIPRKKKFYKKDSEGYYYIPEIIEKQ